MKKIKFASDLASLDCVRIGGFYYQVLTTESCGEERVKICLQPIGLEEYVAFIECHQDSPWITI